MANIQDLLTETSAEPLRPDLTYDNDFQSMESAAQGKVEQQFGDTVIPAEPPDWRDVERQASALMQRTKDLRVAVLLCRAWTILHGLLGTLQGLQLCAALLERHWEHVHPLPEDGDDYFMRMNALGTLSDVTGFVRDLRNADFLRGALGQISVARRRTDGQGNVPEDLPHLTDEAAWPRPAHMPRATTRWPSPCAAGTRPDPRLLRTAPAQPPAARARRPAPAAAGPRSMAAPRPQATPTRPLKPIRPHRPARGRPGIPARARHPPHPGTHREQAIAQLLKSPPWRYAEPSNPAPCSSAAPPASCAWASWTSCANCRPTAWPRWK
jgi:type VI secretion system protein ImpA